MSRTFQESIYVCSFEREERGPWIRADWLRRKDFVEFELGTKCRDEIPDTASANIDSLSVPNGERRTERTVRRAGVFERARVTGILMSRARCDVAQTVETIVRRSASVTTPT